MKLDSWRLPSVPAAEPVTGKLRALIRPDSGLVFHSTARSASARANDALSVISANLFHDWPLRRRIVERLEAFSRLVEQRGADIILLQEVTRTRKFRVDEWLAERLGMSYAYLRANGHAESGFEEGVAIYSRFPLSTPRVRRLLPRQFPLVNRVALSANTHTPWGIIPFFNAHLGQGRRKNQGQLNHLHNWVAEVTGGDTALIGGDFNADEFSPQLRLARKSWIDLFRHKHPTADGTTYELNWPWGAPMVRYRLDYLFLQPGSQAWRVLEAGHLSSPERSHSDHLAVFARLAPL